MNLGAAAQAMGLGMGNAMLVGQDMAQKDAQTQQTRSNTAMQQMQMAMAQKEMKDNQDMSADFAANMKTAGDGISLTQKMAKAAVKTAADMVERNNFTGAQKMTALATQYDSQVKAEANNLLQQQQTAKEGTALSAQQYVASPTPEAAQDLRQKAIAAGEDPKNIPLSTDPKFATWAQQKTKDGLSSKEVLTMEEKKREYDATAAEKQREFNQREADRLAAAAALAAQRDQTNAIARGNLDLHRMLVQDRIEARKAKAEGSGPLTAQQKNTVDAVGNMAGEGVRTMTSLGKFFNTTTAGAFSDMHGGTAMKNLAAAGTNIVTPETVQQFQTALTGFGRAVLLAETAGIGRAPTAAQIQEMQRSIGPAVGDTVFTSAYKIATGNAIMLNRLERTHDNPDPKLKAKTDEDIAYMRKLPTPDQVFEAAQKDPKARVQIAKFGSNFQSTLERMKDAVGSNPEQAPVAAPALPAGWK